MLVERYCIDSPQVCSALPAEGTEHRIQQHYFFPQPALSKCLRSETKKRRRGQDNVSAAPPAALPF